MSEETYGFDQARVRLEEIAAQVKRKDTSLEKSLDLLEEGVRLANQCTEQIDHTQWRSVVETPAADAGQEAAEDGAPLADGEEAEASAELAGEPAKVDGERADADSAQDAEAAEDEASAGWDGARDAGDPGDGDEASPAT